MKIYDKITPEGTRDVVFEECAVRRQVGKELAELFSASGFGEVHTPNLEFYDVFYSNSRYFPQEKIYKLTDQKGRLMVIRPDCTIPIARLVSTKLSGHPLPIRLFYDETVYSISESMRGKSNEQRQLGAELIGENGWKADLEMLYLAAQCLQCCDAGDRKKFRIEICHIGIFKALIEALQVDEETREQIRELIESKNYALLNDMLEEFPKSQAVDELKALPRLFGGTDLFSSAQHIFKNKQVLEILEYLHRLYEQLDALGLKDQVIFDLGLVNQAEYYTGVIFRGYLEGVGEPVLSGGRYDNLLGDFDEKLPAIGFAVNLSTVAKSILKQTEKNDSLSGVLVFSEKGFEAQALRFCAKLRKSGEKCEYSLAQTEQEAEQYRQLKGLKKLIRIGAETKELH